MTSEDLINLLKQGVASWNAWREQHQSEEIPSFSDVDFENMQLQEINFQHMHIHDANLQGANLRKANLQYAHLPDISFQKATISEIDGKYAHFSNADFRGADVRGADFAHASLIHADFRGADVRGADFNSASLSSSCFIQANLHETNFFATDLTRTDFREANMQETELSEANAMFASFFQTNLREAHLKHTNLLGANLCEANLSFADLREASLIGANLIQTNLEETYLIAANLTGTILRQTNVRGASIGFTVFGDHDLRNVEGLDEVIHKGPSPISVMTLYQSAGMLPLNFLRGTGLIEPFLSSLPTFFQKPFLHTTCFIKSIPKNDLLVEQLATDLRSRGIRCWFFLESDDIRDAVPSFAETIVEDQDLQLLILSKTAISDRFVQRRTDTEPKLFPSVGSKLVQQALQKEQEQQRTLLFVIFLDQEAQESLLPWIVNLREQGRIINFVQWENEQHYRHSFESLYQKLMEVEKERV